jgi:hypothetical protein
LHDGGFTAIEVNFSGFHPSYRRGFQGQLLSRQRLGCQFRRAPPTISGVAAEFIVQVVPDLEDNSQGGRFYLELN